MRRLSSTIALLAVFAVSAAADEASLPARVERAALDAALGAVSAPDRFEVADVRFAGADPVSGPVTLERLDVDGPNASGRTRVQLSMLDASGVPAGTARAVVRGRLRGPALVAVRMLRVGESIESDAVGLADVDLTGLRGTPLRDLNALVDLGPLRSLGAGRVLTDALLAPLPVVRRNEPIDLVVKRGSLTVRTKGRVRRDAAPGEIVVAENLRTGAEVLGRVRSDGTLLVVRGAVHGRMK